MHTCMMNFKLALAVLLCEAVRTGWSLANDTTGATSQFTQEARHESHRTAAADVDDGGSLPDRPLQLVRPDPVHHRNLELVPENVKRLHHVNKAVAVVAVVGKFHSGKSFLLNQLMGKQEGFGVGPTVRPKTMGIWMWGKPLEILLPSGEPLSVIFVDTEGFAANNISESYDAKIFSVAALLSSYLIYNSVKIIDQADIDYLELLSRRTQLFALRSQVTKAQWFDQFNHDLLKFPPLLWVVEDFVQVTEGEETSVEWLRRIMETNSREDNKHGVNLLGIFDKVDCVTLFLPATTKTLLQDLSKAREEDLTPEYREERDRLLSHLKKGLVPKEKNGKPITGRELATLLEILVTAANEGSLAEIPGRWETFISQLRVGALEDCITYYESNVEVLLKKHNHGAINESELREWHKASKKNATQLLSQLLLGLDQVNSTFAELTSVADEKFESVRDLNEKKIQIACSGAQRKIEVEAEEEAQLCELPMKMSQLNEIYKSIQKKALARYKEEVGFLEGNSAYRRHLDQLKAGLEYVFKGVSLKNTLALEAILNTAIEAAVEKYRDSAMNRNGIPRTTSDMKSVFSRARAEAEKVFAEKAASVEGESLYTPFQGHLNTKLAHEEELCKKENLDLVRASCKAIAGNLVDQCIHNTGPSKMVLPLNDTELRRRLAQEEKFALKEYTEVQAEFSDTLAYKEVKQELDERLIAVWKQRENENYEAYIREVQVPLNTAKKLIMLSADKYDTEFSVTQYMKEVCLLNLDEGKAKDWQRSLKITIVDKFIRDSDDLQEIVNSKRGWWSAIKGFFQWLASLLMM